MIVRFHYQKDYYEYEDENKKCSRIMLMLTLCWKILPQKCQSDVTLLQSMTSFSARWELLHAVFNLKAILDQSRWGDKTSPQD